MGVHVILEVESAGIDTESWASAFDESAAMLEAWPTRLLGWGTRDIDGVRMPMYSRSIRDDADPSRARLSLVGDRESLRCAESFSLPRAFGPGAGSSLRSAPDILVLAAEDYGVGRRLVRIFGEKTQGLPYHSAVMALGMLFEERFPRSAVLRGDIDREDADVARRMAAPILGRQLPLPVCVDAPRLIGRLRESLTGGALDEAIEHLFRGEAHELLEARLRALTCADRARWWRDALARSEEPDEHDAVSLLVAWLDGGGSVAEAASLACLDGDGPRRTPGYFVEALASSWLVIPPDARSRAAHDGAALDGRALTMHAWMLDRALGGRHLRAFESMDSVAVTLRSTFGDGGAALAARLRERSDEVLRGLREMAGNLKGFAASLGVDPYEAYEGLATLCSLEAMSAEVRMVVHGLAWNVGRALDAVRERGAALARDADATRLKRELVHFLYRSPPTLTEDAWDNLLALRDPEELAWIVALASLNASAMHLSRTRRALLENPTLRAYAIGVSRDASAMREVAELFTAAIKP